MKKILFGCVLIFFSLSSIAADRIDPYVLSKLTHSPDQRIGWVESQAKKNTITMQHHRNLVCLCLAATCVVYSIPIGIFATAAGVNNSEVRSALLLTAGVMTVGLTPLLIRACQHAKLRVDEDRANRTLDLEQNTVETIICQCAKIYPMIRKGNPVSNEWLICMNSQNIQDFIAFLDKTGKLKREKTQVEDVVAAVLEAVIFELSSIIGTRQLHSLPNLDRVASKTIGMSAFIELAIDFLNRQRQEALDLENAIEDLKAEFD